MLCLHHRLLAVLVLSVACVRASSAALPTYELTRLNASNLVARGGTGQMTGPNSGFQSPAPLWTPTQPNGTSGSLTAINSLYLGHGINSSAQIVGEGPGPLNGVNHAYGWYPTTPNATTGTAVRLPTPPGANEVAYAGKINDYGQIIGKIFTPAGIRAAMWTPSQAGGHDWNYTVLGATLAGNSDTSAINNRGQVVGMTASGSEMFLWNPTTANATTGAFTTLPNPANSQFGAAPVDMNASGAVAVQRYGSNSNTNRGFVWTPDVPNGTTGTYTDLGLLPQTTGVWVTAIGADGMVAGETNRNGAASGAFVWTLDSGMVDLASLVTLGAPSTPWGLYSVQSVGTDGKLLATFWTTIQGPNGSIEIDDAVLLSPIPEPASLWILLGSIAMLRRVRRA